MARASSIVIPAMFQKYQPRGGPSICHLDRGTTASQGQGSTRGARDRWLATPGQMQIPSGAWKNLWDDWSREQQERWREIPNCYVGECGIAGCGLLEPLCLGNVPNSDDFRTDCVDSR